MYLTEVLTRTKKGKISHRCVLLRQSYRQDGKTRNRTIANLTHCTPEEIRAIRLALDHKSDLSVLGSLSDSVQLQAGASIGSTWTVYQIARRLGIEKALGTDRPGRLALWQVMARVMEQGSRLSSVRLAQRYAVCDILGLRRGFDENDLYANFPWLVQHQDAIEDRLFRERHASRKPDLYLYDVTSSYLEGECNELSSFGYNRDGKRGKKQIVIGLLCDGEGCPLSIEVFKGNTQDPKTFSPQIKKAAERFGARDVTFVGDRGMIKSGQIKELGEEHFHFITAITKPQIEKLLEENVFQMELFDQLLAEVTVKGEPLRYILRRNPQRAQEMQATRQAKLDWLENKVHESNQYLADHRRAKTDLALAKLTKKANGLKLSGWVKMTLEGRVIEVRTDSEVLKEEQKLDGCYVLKTDLPANVASRQVIHDRYKDLALVEQAFRTSKTAHLEMRPVYVVLEKSTRAHALVVMLAYQIVRHLQQAWAPFNLTVEEGLRELSTICSIEVLIKNQASCHRIPKPSERVAQLLKSLDIQLPEALPRLNARVVSRKKLQDRRKTS